MCQSRGALRASAGKAVVWRSDWCWAAGWLCLMSIEPCALPCARRHKFLHTPCAPTVVKHPSHNRVGLLASESAVNDCPGVIGRPLRSGWSSTRTPEAPGTADAHSAVLLTAAPHSSLQRLHCLQCYTPCAVPHRRATAQHTAIVHTDP